MFCPQLSMETFFRAVRWKGRGDWMAGRLEPHSLSLSSQLGNMKGIVLKHGFGFNFISLLYLMCFSWLRRLSKDNWVSRLDCTEPDSIMKPVGKHETLHAGPTFPQHSSWPAQPSHCTVSQYGGSSWISTAVSSLQLTPGLLLHCEGLLSLRICRIAAVWST